MLFRSAATASLSSISTPASITILAISDSTGSIGLPFFFLLTLEKVLPIRGFKRDANFCTAGLATAPIAASSAAPSDLSTAPPSPVPVP